MRSWSSGSEADVYHDKENGLVYKFYRVRTERWGTVTCPASFTCAETMRSV